MAYPLIAHMIDRRLLGRMNSVIVLGLIVSGMATCVIGASVYDVGRLLSLW